MLTREIENGAAGRIWTYDQLVNSLSLSPTWCEVSCSTGLSYGGKSTRC
jgi:hypothetical protein